MASGYLIKNKEGKTLYYDPSTKKARNFNIPKGASFKKAAAPAKKASVKKEKPGESGMARKEAAAQKKKAKPRTYRDAEESKVVNKQGESIMVKQTPRGGVIARVVDGNPFASNKRKKIFIGTRRPSPYDLSIKSGSE